MVAGILLGPSFLGALAPGAFAFLFQPLVIEPLGLLSQVGVVVYMFLVGVELDVDTMRHQLRGTLAVALAGVVIPLGFGMAWPLWLDRGLVEWAAPDWQLAAFVGIALAITAFPVLARILEEARLTTRPVGVRALGSAAVADVVVWAALGVFAGVVENRAGAALAPILAGVFVVLMVVAVRPFATRISSWRVAQGDAGIPLALGALAVVAFAARGAGVHAIVGGFLLGVGVPAASPLAARLGLSLRGPIEMALLPAFFAVSGLQTQIGLVRGIDGWLACAAIIMVATVGKLGATAVAARLVGAAWRESLALGFLMNVRGLMLIVVLNVGLDLGLVSPTLYTMMVLMALATTMMAGPALRLLRIGGDR